MKKLAFIAMILALSACSRDSTVASSNLSQAADSFQINRRIVFYDAIQGKYLLSIEGLCAINIDEIKNKLDVTCKTGTDSYKKHYLGIADNVTYFVEQLEQSKVSLYHYKVTFKPEVIIPDIDLSVSK